ncbi:MAG: amino acid permease [Flavobacteriales bacterium]|nr:amino acid permease [Flavobacteriales bacterium]
MHGLQRRFGFNTTVAIIVGTVIGSGIFMKPALMASQLGSPLLLLSVWVLAGIVSLFGAMSNAELAAADPDTGGPYVYFRKIYGEGFAFLYGWAAFAVFNTAGTASIAYVFAHYASWFIDLPSFPDRTVSSLVIHLPGVGALMPLENIGEKLLTVLLVTLLTILNYFSAGMGGAVQRVLTTLKAMAIALLIIGLLAGGGGSSDHELFAATTNGPVGWALLAAYFAALGGAFWAYDGWNNISFIAGEIKEPQRNIPRGLFVGMVFCVLVYVLVNLTYLYVLPIATMAGSTLVASDAAKVVWGSIRRWLGGRAGRPEHHGCNECERARHRARDLCRWRTVQGPVMGGQGAPHLADAGQRFAAPARVDASAHFQWFLRHAHRHAHFRELVLLRDARAGSDPPAHAGQGYPSIVQCTGLSVGAWFVRLVHCGLPRDHSVVGCRGLSRWPKCLDQFAIGYAHHLRWSADLSFVAEGKAPR